MNIRAFVAGAVALASLFLAGCAQRPLEPVTWTPPASTSSSAVRIGIVIGSLPKADTSFPGAGCLLCLAAASAANSDLTKHAATLSTQDLAAVKGELADLLRKRGYDPVAITEDVDVSKLEKFSGNAPHSAIKDFRALKDKYHVEKLAVVEYWFVGFERTYASYIPTSAPLARVQGVGYIVDLAANTYDWYTPFNATKSTEGEWSEPPAFPGLTNAYYQAIESAKDQLKKPFKN